MLYLCPLFDRLLVWSAVYCVTCVFLYYFRTL